VDHSIAGARNLSNYGLPADYVGRPAPIYFDDSPYVESKIIHQPEVYQAADYFLKDRRRTTIIDVGCGNGRKLRSVEAARHIGVDFGSNLSLCRELFGEWGEWVETDLSSENCVAISELADERAVVVCADVVEHLLNPEWLVALLASCYRRGAIVLTSTPDRIRVRGPHHRGPPPNPSHIREWALDEYAGFLVDHGLPPIFAGYTLNNNVECELKTIITIHDIVVDRALLARQRKSAMFEPFADQGEDVSAGAQRPVAIVSAYNEADVIAETGEDLIHQGCDLIAIDNWSTDQTLAVLEALAARHPSHVRVERFPEQAVKHSEWRRILHFKAWIASHFPGRWIIHSDADEIRRSPFPGLTLAEGLYVAQNVGANRIDFNVMNFRPVDSTPFQPGTLTSHFSHFEYGAGRDGHFLQSKAWLQGTETVDLVSSGGHVAVFSGAVDFRYKFLLQHYPIRSVEHGRRKVFEERQARWSPQERASGLHVHYENLSETSSFVWPPQKLHQRNARFWSEHGLPLITDIAERRSGAVPPR
jgi:SAM-dependent methyltransferase